MKIDKATELSLKNGELVKQVRAMQAEVNAACIDENKDHVDRLNRKFSEVISLIRSLSTMIVVTDFAES